MDQKFWPKNPDPDFNPARNKLIIEGTIRKYEATRKRKMEEFSDQVKERTDAVASWLTSRKGAESSKSLDQYFGSRHLAYLRGKEKVDEIRRSLGIESNKAPRIFNSMGEIVEADVKTKVKKHKKKKGRKTVA